MRYWYAILKDREDSDWGTGSFSLSEALMKARELGYPLIAEIDGNFDKNGNPTTDPICTQEYIVDDLNEVDIIWCIRENLNYAINNDPAFIEEDYDLDKWTAFYLWCVQNLTEVYGITEEEAKKEVNAFREEFDMVVNGKE